MDFEIAGRKTRPVIRSPTFWRTKVPETGPTSDGISNSESSFSKSRDLTRARVRNRSSRVPIRSSARAPDAQAAAGRLPKGPACRGIEPPASCSTSFLIRSTIGNSPPVRRVAIPHCRVNVLAIVTETMDAPARHHCRMAPPGVVVFILYAAGLDRVDSGERAGCRTGQSWRGYSSDCASGELLLNCSRSKSLQRLISQPAGVVSEDSCV